MKGKLEHRRDASERVALAVLEWLVRDDRRLFAFLDQSGLSPGTLRESARDPAFLGAVLDFVMSDEPGLLACAREIGLRPEQIAGAWQRIQPPDFDHSS